MMKFTLRLVLGAVAALVLVLAVLLFVASRSDPLPATDTALATLAPAERAALERVCATIGVLPASLRLLAAHDANLFDHALNRSAITVREGHLTGLSLQGAKFSEPADFSGLDALVTLDLRGSGLSQWPKLSTLAALRTLNLSGNPLPTPDNTTLPPGLTVLKLADTQVAQVQPFARLTQLLELDLSGTRVTEFDALLSLPLERLNLSRTPLASLPASLPVAGGWALDLDGTTLVNPPGFAEKWPFGDWVDATPRDADTAQGSVSHARVDVSGSVAPLAKPLRVALPRTKDANAPPVQLETSVTSGKARIWMEAPPALFGSPWFAAGKVKGFGSLRGRGYVFAEVALDKPATLHGKLGMTTVNRNPNRYNAAGQRNLMLPGDTWIHYDFYVEPIDGQTVTGLKYRVTAQP